MQIEHKQLNFKALVGKTKDGHYQFRLTKPVSFVSGNFESFTEAHNAAYKLLDLVACTTNRGVKNGKELFA